ncbi:hypothetical protein CDAR_496061 [Caerostris darwini]|uniref:Single domain-containing protein n=1 Tax=Caerostris darwini TaxID=1538125 RepID=A0AAV4U1N4_9ARAC|nr:hypothetical protein CDAR_496061 [Caerostris darwini]
MQQIKVLSYLMLSVSVYFSAFGDGYVWRERLDTSNGFCEHEYYGKIAVGDVGYDDIACEKIVCKSGRAIGHGCSYVELEGMPGCRLVEYPGHYPACCGYHLECGYEYEEDWSMNSS